MIKQSLIIPLISILLIIGCTFQHTFDHEPIVSVTYFPNKNETQFATRNMVIDHRDCKEGKICTVIMQAVILTPGQPKEREVSGRVVLRFRGLSTLPRFQEERQVIFQIADSTYNLGEFIPTAIRQKNDYVIEDFLIDIDEYVLHKLATAENVEGNLGPINLNINQKILKPLSALIDTTFYVN